MDAMATSRDVGQPCDIHGGDTGRQANQPNDSFWSPHHTGATPGLDQPDTPHRPPSDGHSDRSSSFTVVSEVGSNIFDDYDNVSWCVGRNKRFDHYSDDLDDMERGRWFDRGRHRPSVSESFWLAKDNADFDRHNDRRDRTDDSFGRMRAGRQSIKLATSSDTEANRRSVTEADPIIFANSSHPYRTSPAADIFEPHKLRDRNSDWLETEYRRSRPYRDSYDRRTHRYQDVHGSRSQLTPTGCDGYRVRRRWVPMAGG